MTRFSGFDIHLRLNGSTGTASCPGHSVPRGEAARLGAWSVKRFWLELAADWHLDEAFFEVSLVTIKTKAISFH